MQNNKLSTFFITSTDDKGATRQLKFVARSLSVEIVDKLAAIESEIPTLRRRARNIMDLVRKCEKDSQREGVAFEVKAAEMVSPAVAEILCTAYELGYTVQDIEDSMADHSRSIIAQTNAKRIQVLQIVADRNKMDPADIKLLDSPLVAPEPAAVEPKEGEAAKVSTEEVSTVVEADTSFWRNADVGQLAEAADFFRRAIKD